MKIRWKTLTRRTLGWFSRPVRWFGKPLGKLAKPLAKIEGIERPAVYLGFAFVLWRLWVDQRATRSARGERRGSSPSAGTRRRRPSLRLLVQERLNRAAYERSEDHKPRPSA